MHAEDYTGTDQIQVGNGQGLHISNSGRGLLPTLSRNFHLFSLFHVPQIQKNLISVTQFTRDNHVFIEFHPTCFYVKDLWTRQLLLQGPSKLDLYPWTSFAASTFDLLLPSLVKRFLWISGISGLVILPLLLSTKLFNPKSCLCLHQSLPPFALHVNRARVIVFILAILLLFPINLFNYCFFMYRALPPQPL